MSDFLNFGGELHLDGKVHLFNGDSREVLKLLPDASVDSVVTDPPYALVSIVKRFGSENAAPATGDDAYSRASAGFMGKTWDTGETAFAVEFWAEVMRVLKPGGHVVAASGTRTYHRLAVAVEDAGFEIRDMVMEYIESNTFLRTFFHSLNDEQKRAFVRMIDESMFGGIINWNYGSGFPKSHDVSKGIDKALGVERAIVSAATDRRGDGTVYGIGHSGVLTSDQPATPEAAQWQGWGTALKPACEPWVLARKPFKGTVAANVLEHGTGAINVDGCRISTEGEKITPNIRDPSNSHEGWVRPWMSDKAKVASGQERAYAVMQAKGRFPANILTDGSEEVANGGLPLRYFYSAKADKMDRAGSKHPTVKPVDLMQYLCRLITPPGGIVLDPFAGSGSTGEAAWREGFRCVLVEREEEYADDIRQRLRLAKQGTGSRKRAITKQESLPEDGLFGLFGGQGV